MPCTVRDIRTISGDFEGLAGLVEWEEDLQDLPGSEDWLEGQLRTANSVSVTKTISDLEDKQETNKSHQSTS